MTTVDRYPSGAPYGQIRRRVTGTPEEVAAAVALVRQSGRVLAVSLPRQLHPADPRVTVVVTLRDQPAARTARRRVRRRWIKPTVITTAATVTLAGIGYGLFQLTTVVSRAVATPAVLGGLFVLVMLIAVGRWLTGSSSCGGLHCSGCRRH